MHNLFDVLPPDIFRPLAAGSRRIYASLLLHLEQTSFTAIGETPRRHVVLTDIADFLIQFPVEDEVLQDAEELQGISNERRMILAREADGRDMRCYSIFHYLVECGWLIEMQDHYRKLVDLSPEGRMLLRELRAIASGDKRSYGGAVLNVLGALDAALADPEAKSENIRNAAESARNFSHHLRVLSARLYQFEQQALARENRRLMFRNFFEDFIADFLISDYRTLRTANNPFRFRHNILERTQEIGGDALTLARLAQGYVTEGRCANETAAEAQILAELDEVYQVFSRINEQLDIIDDVQMRIERKIQTVIRYMDRDDDGGALERAKAALRALGNTRLPAKADVGVAGFVLNASPLLGTDILYLKTPERTPVARTAFIRTRIDPALQAFHDAKIAHARRLSVSPAKMRDYLHSLLGGRSRIKGSEIAIDDVDQFILFQRLRDVPFMFGGLLARDYQVTPLPQRARNDWLEFKDFEVAKRSRQEPL